jgi:hypothetical protein
MAQRTRNQSRTHLALAALLCAACIAGMTGCKKVKVKPERTSVVKTFTPSWYDVSARSEDRTLIETAQANMATRELAEAAAINSARANLALTIETRVDVLQRNFTEQVNALNDPEVLRRFQDANNIVASTTLRGSYLARKETYIEPDGSYRSFVMMRLDGGDIDLNYFDALRQIQLLETRLRSSEAWSELEKRAKELRDERNRSGALPPMTDREIRGGN